MTTVKIKLRPSISFDNKLTIYYQIIHKRVVRQIKTDYTIFKKEWDFEKSCVISSDNFRKAYLISIRDNMEWDIRRLKNIIEHMENKGDQYVSDDIVNKFYEAISEQSFIHFMKDVIIQLKRLGKAQTAENYVATLNSFMRFRNGNNILSDEINSDLMMEYEAYLKGYGISMNTISFYMRILRAVYNRIVDKGLTQQRFPFKHVYTGIDKTMKRAISLKEIKRIKMLDLSAKPSLKFARDMFMFSFYTRGMSFVDMAYLKRSDLKNNVLSYRRKKTGQQFFIKWEKCMQEIVGQYNATGTGFLLPIVRTVGNERQQYRNALRLVNNKLKIIAIMAGVDVNLTMYVSRHSWANIAKNQNVPIAIISEGMGHDSEATTKIYLSSFDNSKIDKANEKIIRNLR